MSCFRSVEAVNLLVAISIGAPDAEGEPDALADAVRIHTLGVTDLIIRTTRAEASHTMAERKLNASAAFQRPQELVL